MRGRIPAAAATGFVKDPGIGPGRRGAAGTRALPELAFVFFVPKILAVVTEGSRPS